MISVLFVCLGNICRSPMAEAVFRHKVRAAGLEARIEADSAGIGDWHVGGPAHAGTRKLLTENEIDCDHCARQIARADFDRFDYILTMDEQNLSDVRALARRNPGRARIAPLMEFAPDAGVGEVPDPYYDGRFAEVYTLVGQATEGLLDHIRREHGL